MGINDINSLSHTEQFGELKYKYRNREFWCKGYYVDTVGKNELHFFTFAFSAVLHPTVLAALGFQ